MWRAMTKPRLFSSMFYMIWSVPGRVRVAVRLRPRNGEEQVADADFADCVELQPEVNIKLLLLFLFHSNSDRIASRSALIFYDLD